MTRFHSGRSLQLVCGRAISQAWLNMFLALKMHCEGLRRAVAFAFAKSNLKDGQGEANACLRILSTRVFDGNLTYVSLSSI